MKPGIKPAPPKTSSRSGMLVLNLRLKISGMTTSDALVKLAFADLTSTFITEKTIGFIFGQHNKIFWTDVVLF